MAKLVQIPKKLIPLAELALMEGRTPTKHEWKTWMLDGPAIWSDNNVIVNVPSGFLTDFASIPFLFRWWQTGSVGPQRVAAYFHDYLYSEQSIISRAEADKIFRLVMKYASDTGLRNKIRRWTMWAALRVGGYWAWKSNQKKLKEQGSGWRQL